MLTQPPQPPLTQQVWHIANYAIRGKMILAPMEGYSDQPFRLLCHQFGASDLSTTEFINAIDLIHGHPYMVKNRIRFSPEERPISIQIFDNEPERLFKAAKVVMAYNPNFIDINMGCSVKKVSNRGAGAGLLRTPQKIAQIFSTLSKELPLPITGKIRLGWDDKSLNYPEIAHIIEDNGGAAITIHARTRAQGYSGEANWDAIAEIKQRVSIPVIGNGDIKSLDQATKMLGYAQCDAVMVGRAAIGNPWCFSDQPKTDRSVPDIITTLLSHLQSMLDFYGERVGMLQFRKHAVAYLSPFALTSEERRNLLTTETKIDFTQSLESLNLRQRPRN